MTDSREPEYYHLSGLETGVVADWIAGVALVAILAVAALYRAFASTATYPEIINEIHEVRRQGDVSRAEFENRLDAILSPEQRRLRGDLRRRTDVSPETATKIAHRFDSIERLRAADSEAIAETSGVSVPVAERISERISSDAPSCSAESGTHTPVD